MDNFGNIHPLAFEPVRKILAAAYRSRDFRAADEVIVRNTVKEAVIIHRLVNGAMDAYCWSGARGTSYMLSRTSHPGYTLQLTIFHRGHAWEDINVKHAGKGELSLPDGVCAVGIEHADSGIEEELAERFGIYITPDVYERFGCVGEGPSAGNPFDWMRGMLSAKYRVRSVSRQHPLPRRIHREDIGISMNNWSHRMDINRNIFPIAFEPVEELIDAAYISDDFTLADAAIARNTVKETNMISRLVNDAMDAYCWSSGRGVSHMLSRTSHPGYTLQLTDFYQGRAIGDIDIKHAGELCLPDGVCAVGVEDADLGIEEELAECFGIYITQDSYEQFGRDSDGLEIDGVIQPERRGTECKLSSDER